jgi:predicted  nucleic acid-binding Zn-ribbon protein
MKREIVQQAETRAQGSKSERPMMNGKAAAAPDPSAAPPPSINWLILGLAFCALIAASATMTTTGLGMYTIFGNPWVAAVMTLLAEVVLFATSWILGRDIARLASGEVGKATTGRGLLGNSIRSGFLLATFALVFFICWFFSFNFYFNQMFSGGEDRLEAEQLPHQAADPALTQLGQLVDKAVADNAKAMLAAPEMTDYIAWLGLLEKQAKDGAVAGQLKAQQASDEAERQRRLSDAQSDIARLTGDLNRLEVDRRPIEATLKAERSDNEADSSQIDKLQAQLRDLGSQKSALETQAGEENAVGRDGRKPGPGTEFQALQTRVAKFDQQINRIRSLELAPLEKKQNDRASVIASGEAALAENERKVAELRQKITVANAQLPTTTADAATSTGDLVTQLVAVRTRFTENPAPDLYNALVEACTPVALALRGVPQVADKLAGNDCRSDAVSLQLSARPKLLAAQQDYLKACAPDIVNAKIRGVNDTLGKQLLAQGNVSRSDRRDLLATALQATQNDIVIPCIALAGQAGVRDEDTTKIESKLRLFVQSHRLDQNSFSQTLTAASSLLDGTANNSAWLGAIIGLTQDIFLLLLSILRELIQRDDTARPAPRRAAIAVIDWAPKPGDPPPIAAAKAILRAARDDARGGVVLRPDFDTDLTPDQRDNAVQILRQLTRSEAARRDQEGKWLLSNEAVEQIEQSILDYRPPPATPPAEPAPVPAPSPQESDVPLDGATPEPRIGVSPALAAPRTMDVGPEQPKRRRAPAVLDTSRYVELPADVERRRAESRSPQTPPESDQTVERLRTLTKGKQPAPSAGAGRTAPKV